MSDLRNIVDRLDVLMHTSSAAVEGPSPGPQLGEVVSDLADRVAGLEGEVSELRTLVNHLMTIATWQARVTATLVGEGDDADDGPVEPADDERRYGVRSSPPAGDHRAREADVDRAPRGSGTTTLDEDIDDILGTDRGSSTRDAPPPDFGI